MPPSLLHKSRRKWMGLQGKSGIAPAGGPAQNAGTPPPRAGGGADRSIRLRAAFQAGGHMGPPLRRIQTGAFFSQGPVLNRPTGGAHPRAASLGLRPIHLQPLPYSFPETLPGLGGGGPWASRRDLHQPQFSTQIGRRRRPPTQSPAQRVCVGEEERWSERALPGPGEARDTKSATTMCAGNVLPGPRGNPRNGGSRGWGSWRMRRSRIRLAPPPSAFLVTFWAAKKSLAAGAAKSPCNYESSRFRMARAACTPEAPAWARPRVTPAPSPAAKKLGMAVSSSSLSWRRAE